MDNKIELIVRADEPALFFTNIDIAERYLERIDVDNGIYKEVFGPEGELYSISSNDVGVKIDRLPGPIDPDGLKEVLRHFLEVSCIEYSPDDKISDLLTHCERFVIKR